MLQQQYQTLINLIHKSKFDNSVDVVPTHASQIGSVNTCVKGNLGGKIFSANRFNKNKCCWILDSGATNHLSCSLGNFLSYNVMELAIVKLPNEKYVNVTHKWVVKITEKLFLQNVVYIPDFNYNIIFVSQLTFSHNLKLIFFSKTCIIQDT